MLKYWKIISILLIITSVLIIINLNTHNIDDETIKTTQKEEINEEIIDEIIKEKETNEENLIVSHGYYISTIINENEEGETYYFINHEDHYIPFHKKQIQYNYNKGITIKPKYIVIHETANTAVGANANAHYRYWNRDPNANASTHFVVDNEEIYQMLELNQSAWHVGDNKGHSDITNLNSIGIEIAVNADGDFYQARKNAIYLTINLMKELNMDISQLKRHHDASGKYCPANMLTNDELWTDFVNQVKIGLNK